MGQNSRHRKSRLGIKNWRHIATAISRRYIQDASSISPELYKEPDLEDSEGESEEQPAREKDTIINL